MSSDSAGQGDLKIGWTPGRHTPKGDTDALHNDRARHPGHPIEGEAMARALQATRVVALLALSACASAAVSSTPSTGGTPADANPSTPSSTAASNGNSTASTSASGTPGASAAATALRTNVVDGAKDVPVDTLLTVTPAGARVTRVSVESTASGKDAARIGGNIGSDGVWTADNRLDPGARYTVTATGTSDDGSEQTIETTFRTAALTRSQQVFPTLTPVLGGPFGVAQPIVIAFDTPITDKASVERALKVTSSPAQEGSWGWIDAKTVHYRPKAYWKPGTKITLDARLNGVNAGGGHYGQLNRTLDLTIGRAQSGTVDIAKHSISWTREGKVVGTWPMTAGKPGFTTRSGTKVVMEKAENITMASETTGIARDSSEGYNVKVALALRVTGSGEFIHSAPWNEGNFGVRNASHGCVGMGDDTMWKLYQVVQIGDPVTFTGSNRKLEDGNGWTDWNQTWDQWKARSALK